MVASSEARPTPEAIAALLPGFVGAIEQVPPRYSAIKIEGERAYDIARDGEEFELKARVVNIERLQLEETPIPTTAGSWPNVARELTCGRSPATSPAARLLGPCIGAAADRGRAVRRGGHDFAGTARGFVP